ncbi:MAG: hypothetical protein ACT4OD_05835 [Candidatus Nitrosotenuis sp.]
MSKMFTRSELDPNKEILKKILTLTEDGTIDPRQLEDLLTAVINEAKNERDQHEIRSSIENLFERGIIRTVSESTQIKDKGLIISTRTIVRPTKVSSVLKTEDPKEIPA